MFWISDNGVEVSGGIGEKLKSNRYSTFVLCSRNEALFCKPIRASSTLL